MKTKTHNIFQSCFYRAEFAETDPVVDYRGRGPAAHMYNTACHCTFWPIYFSFQKDMAPPQRCVPHPIHVGKDTKYNPSFPFIPTPFLRTGIVFHKGVSETYERNTLEAYPPDYHWNGTAQPNNFCLHSTAQCVHMGDQQKGKSYKMLLQTL